jgi:hypothetical protein
MENQLFYPLDSFQEKFIVEVKGLKKYKREITKESRPNCNES